MNTETAPGGREPLDQASRLELQACPYRQPVNHIHHHHKKALPNGTEFCDLSFIRQDATLSLRRPRDAPNI